MPIHLRAAPGDYADAVLCPGDPHRAQYIAETCFDPGFRLVNQERGMLGFTGTVAGAPISVQTTGMGTGSSGIVFEELVMLGARRLVRVGTCGGIDPAVAMGDTIVAVSASTDDHTPLQYAQMDGFAPTATWTLVETAARLARAAGTPVHVGSIVTSGLFYDPDPGVLARWRRLGLLGAEMEAAMLFTIAAVHRVEALTILTVSDLIDAPGEANRISDEALARGVDQMMHLACQVAVS